MCRAFSRFPCQEKNQTGLQKARASLGEPWHVGSYTCGVYVPRTPPSFTKQLSYWCLTRAKLDGELFIRVYLIKSHSNVKKNRWTIITPILKMKKRSQRKVRKLVWMAESGSGPAGSPSKMLSPQSLGTRAGPDSRMMRSEDTEFIFLVYAQLLFVFKKNSNPYF